MATVEKLVGGYSYQFVEEPSEDVKCPICLLVLRDPHLTECCGHNFCEYCITEAKKRNSSCPQCRDKDFKSIRDRKEERKILSLLVYCDYRRDGCTWKGAVKTINDHISHGRLAGECNHVLLSCPNSCGVKLKRSRMRNHIKEKCNLRSYTCKYCFQTGTYKNITQHHFPICASFPIPCPNTCGSAEIARGEMKGHLDVCPQQEVTCPYKEQGCREVHVRCEQPHHIRKAVHDHLALVTTKLTSTTSQLEAMKKQMDTVRGQLDVVLRRLDAKGIIVYMYYAYQLSYFKIVNK